MKLYYHKTGGGAEYLTDKFVVCPNGKKEGVFENANYIIRIDGDISKDAELTITPNNDLLAACKAAMQHLEGCTCCETAEAGAKAMELIDLAMSKAGRQKLPSLKSGKIAKTPVAKVGQK